MEGAGTVLWMGSKCLDIRSGGAAGETWLDFGVPISVVCFQVFVGIS